MCEVIATGSELNFTCSMGRKGPTRGARACGAPRTHRTLRPGRPLRSSRACIALRCDESPVGAGRWVVLIPVNRGIAGAVIGNSVTRTKDASFRPRLAEANAAPATRIFAGVVLMEIWHWSSLPFWRCKVSHHATRALAGLIVARGTGCQASLRTGVGLLEVSGRESCWVMAGDFVTASELHPYHCGS
jgi:hypothetical protein